MNKIIYIFLLFFISIFDLYAEDYYQISNNSLKCINEHGVNRVIENKIGSNLFVPTKTLTEWNTFISYKPGNVYEFTTSWNAGSFGGCSANPTWSSWSSWSSCSVSCGGGIQYATRSCQNTNGTQTRSVICNLSDGRNINDNCCIGIKPNDTQSCNISCIGSDTTSQTCNTQSCYTYSWNTGTFGSCSVSCGGGTQTRSVSCQRNDGVIVSDSYCSGSKATTSQSCNTQACSTSGPYTYGSWSSCSVSCGGGTQTRQQYCNYTSCYSPQATSQSCNTQACTPVTYTCPSGGSVIMTESQVRNSTINIATSGRAFQINSTIGDNGVIDLSNVNLTNGATHGFLVMDSLVNYIGTRKTGVQICGGTYGYPAPVYGTPTINYPTSKEAGSIWTWSISGGQPNESWEATGCGWTSGGKVGPFTLDSSGNAVYNNGTIPTPGTYNIQFKFLTSGHIVNKTIVVTSICGASTNTCILGNPLPGEGCNADLGNSLNYNWICQYNGINTSCNRTYGGCD